MKNGNRIEWVAPTLSEISEIIDRVGIDSVVALLGLARREPIYRWFGKGATKRKISKANFMLLKLYADGVIDIDGSPRPFQERTEDRLQRYISKMGCTRAKAVEDLVEFSLNSGEFSDL